MRSAPDFFDQTQIDHWETRILPVSDQVQLQDFVMDISQIFSLETQGTLSSGQAYNQIKRLVTELQNSVIND
ncbi:hypothetical protein PL11201_430012 [Planktothrix sp. PCC 11201]|uniref:DUF7219 family protein n=1 Tax=Planktothrix sp. PCC 11201 TaxID=1729650 RepID=UPI00091991B4|nr:hypothetical protein [Planktothrix sp. PCC 11201]SKB12769.1 hypothetical protein PL11201_430012 [Planktothrix sp. PCC 11201]